MSKNLRKCFEKLDTSSAMLSDGRINGARRAYSNALQIYLTLEYFDKKEAYLQINELYERLK